MSLMEMLNLNMTKTMTPHKHLAYHGPTGEVEGFETVKEAQDWAAEYILEEYSPELREFADDADKSAVYTLSHIITLPETGKKIEFQPVARPTLTDAQVIELWELANRFTYLDLKDVPFISSGGILEILNKYHEMQQNNGQ